MPNHTSNKLTIRGPHNRITRCIASMASPDRPIDCQKIVPMPYELQCYSSPAPDEMVDQLTAAHGASSWYEWAIANWGTKWGCYDFCDETDHFKDSTGISRQTHDDEASICFLSAWSMPSPVIQRVSEMFPMLDFILEGVDEGLGWACRQLFRDGEMEEESFTDPDSDEFKDITQIFGIAV